MESDELPDRNRSERAYSAEEKERTQEKLLDLYSRRYKVNDIVVEVQKERDISRGTLLTWLKDAIRKQELPDPAFALRRDLLLVDTAIAALIPNVLKGNATAHLALSRWMDRRAKWLGLDAPDKLEAIIKHLHTGPIDEEIRELSERLGIVPPEMLALPSAEPSGYVTVNPPLPGLNNNSVAMEADLPPEKAE